MTTPVLQVRLNLPYDAPHPELVANYRGHWAPKHRATAQVRDTVTLLARQAGLHRYQPGEVEHLTVQLVWAPGDWRRRDATNLHPFTKVVIDALARGPRKDWVGIDLVPDDTAAFVTELPALIVLPPELRGLRVDLRLRFANPDTGAENASNASDPSGPIRTTRRTRTPASDRAGRQSEPFPTERTTDR